MREGYKKTELGWIPNEWNVLKISECSNDIFLGLTSKVDYVESNGVPLIRTKDISKGILNFQNVRYISLKQHDYLTKYRKASKGDVLVSKSGTLGTCCIVDTDKEFSIYESIIAIKTKESIIISKYLVQLLKDDKTLCRMLNKKVGGAVGHLNIKNFRELLIIIPNLKEQKKLADILSTVDEQIENTDNLIEKTKELKKGLMQRLLTKGIGHERFKETEIGRIPEEWEVDKIKDLSSFCSNGFVGTASPFYTDGNEGTPYLMSNNVRANKIDERNVVKITKEFKQQYPRSTIYEGDMLTVQSGHIGTSCIVPKNYNNTNCHALIITRFNKVKIDPLFISYYINSPSGLSRLSCIFVGTTIKHINVKDLIQFYVPVPSFKEQKRISLVLSYVDEKIEQYESKKEKLQELKKGLMQKLLTGKIRVRI